MEEVLKTIIDNLIENKKAISIDHKEENGTDYYYVTVAQDEEGKLIGRQGRVAKAIKALCKALGAKEGRRVEVVFPFKYKKGEGRRSQR